MHSENVTENYSCITEYFDVFFSTPEHIPHVENKRNH